MTRPIKHNDSTPAAADMEVVPTRAGYDRWAEFYDGEDNPLVLLENTHIGPLAGEVAGLAVADIGCGTGPMHSGGPRPARASPPLTSPRPC